MRVMSASPTVAPIQTPSVRYGAPPAINPALARLEPRARDAFCNLLLCLGDSELVIGHRHSEWTGFGPTAEEDVAFSSIAQDEMGHAHLYYALLVGADAEDAVDRLALDRGPRQLRHLPILHAPNGDWFFTTARHIMWDLLESALLRHAVEAHDLPLLAGAARRVLNEEQYHLEHADEWLELLSRRVSDRHRLAGQLVRVLDQVGNPVRAFPGLDDLSELGMLPPRLQIETNYRDMLLERLGDAGWSRGEMATVEAALAHGRVEGLPRPPGLYKLHHDLTGLRRANPGATW
jgi:ring-1,2-phenylacetyl-CoA epoxidase subunit PaaC